MAVGREAGCRGHQEDITVIRGVSCTEVEILLKFYVFSPCESAFLFLLDITHLKRKGKTIILQPFTCEVAIDFFECFVAIYFDACEKTFGNVCFKAGDVS